MFTIAYAYPFSEMAKDLGRSARGCFYVTVEGQDCPAVFETLDDAREFATSTGHEPSRWSMF